MVLKICYFNWPSIEKVINRSLLFFFIYFQGSQKKKVKCRPYHHYKFVLFFSQVWDRQIYRATYYRFKTLHITDSKPYILQSQNITNYCRVKTLHIKDSKHYILQIQNISYYRFKTLHITDSKNYILQMQNLPYYRFKTLHISDSKPYIYYRYITYYRFKTLHITDSKHYILKVQYIT